MATIRIHDLALRTIIGIEPWERETPQDILINLSMEYDSLAAARSDDIHDAVDYKAVKKAILSLVEGARFNLVETMAERILDTAMADPRVRASEVTVAKPHALRFARSVSLTTARRRG